MRSWWKMLGLLAGGLLSLGGMLSPAQAQYLPSLESGVMMPPGGGGMGPLPDGGLLMPPGAGMVGPECCVTPGPPVTGPPQGESPALPSTAYIKRWPAHWQFSVEYLRVWMNPGNAPPLATTGDVNDAFPGALGQPGTVILPSVFNDSRGTNGVRATFTYWLQDPELLSLEASYFIVANRSNQLTFSSDANGDPSLFRPFFNPNTGQEDAKPRSESGTGLQGSMMDSLTTRLMGAEMNLKWYTPLEIQGPGMSFFLGARWLRLEETYSNFDTSTDSIAALTTTTSDTFSTTNQFFGGQAGIECLYRMPRMTFGLLGKIAVGPNYQTIRVSGNSVQTNLTDGSVVTDSSGFYAQHSNIGVYTSTRIAVLPELAAKLDFDLTDYLRIKVGYSYFILSRTVRPGDQIDRSVNDQTFLFGGGFGPPLPAPPGFRQSTFTAQMLNVGLEFRF